MKKKVLIVEDEFIVANNLRLVLERAGYDVYAISASAAEAAEHLRRQRPDIVLLDIRLQGNHSGIELGKKLHEENIPFIYLSAYSNQKILEEARQTNPYGFLVKPFRKKDLLVMLDIASYRHTQDNDHSKQLAQALKAPGAGPQKLQQVATLLQPHIPFDLITMNDIGFLRIGFDEYQFLGEKELLTITNVKQPVLLTEQLLMETFSLSSQLSLPIGPAMKYTLFSRQPGIYNTQHQTTLQQLQTSLTTAAAQIMHATMPAAPYDIIGQHPQLMHALDLAAQVAPYNTSVLILGESGTGKEKVAQSIHALSPVSNGPFIKVNCAAIPATLMESELFGHEKGAFTGAIEKRKGKFEQAEGGTIFLDEIGELPLDMQVKILRVLQEKEIEYIGGNTPVKVNIRILAATNRNLEEEIAAGHFRLDLYYRLNVFPITLPPLRHRKSDIPALATYFAEKFCKEFKKAYTGISATMLSDMQAYHWPGNIRELENMLAQSVILNDGKSPLELMHPLKNTGAASLEDIKHLQLQTEKDYIISILQRTNGRIRGANGAAEILHLKPTTLESKISKLQIRKEDYR